MITVDYPQPQFKIKAENGLKFIFDAIRRQWLRLTEEEWVRQNFVAYLTLNLHYPATMIALEKELVLNGLKKRFDVLIYDSSVQPWMLIECKAPSVPLSEAVFEQVLRYNMSVPVQYLVITNGNHTMCWQKEQNNLQAIMQLPAWGV